MRKCTSGQALWCLRKNGVWLGVTFGDAHVATSTAWRRRHEAANAGAYALPAPRSLHVAYLLFPHADAVPAATAFRWHAYKGMQQGMGGSPVKMHDSSRL